MIKKYLRDYILKREIKSIYLPKILRANVTDLINRIVQVLREDLYWVKISAQNIKLIKPVKP